MKLTKQQRDKIAAFVATHTDCRAGYGESWLAATVYVYGSTRWQTERVLIGRPRTEERAKELFALVEKEVTL